MSAAEIASIFVTVGGAFSGTGMALTSWAKLRRQRKTAKVGVDTYSKYYDAIHAAVRDAVADPIRGQVVFTIEDSEIARVSLTGDKVSDQQEIDAVLEAAEREVEAKGRDFEGS